MGNKKIDALDKAGEMMAIPMNQLPEPAMKFLRYFADKVGFCGEVCVSAYAYYAQAVLGMKCKDPAYKIPQIELDWFIKNNYAKSK